MSIAPVEHVFANADMQAQALVEAVDAQLREGIAARGGAWLAVPGGETPRKFLDALACQELDWPRVSVTLTDERQLPEDDPRSNARLLRECLLDRVPAQFVPLVDARSGKMESATTPKGLPRTFDAVVLGMGADGHCASLFTDGDNIDAALRFDADEPIMSMRSPSVPEVRVTLTLPALVATRALYVLIQGERKRHVLAAALRGAAPFGHAPIRIVLEYAKVPPQIYWCP